MFKIKSRKKERVYLSQIKQENDDKAIVRVDGSTFILFYYLAFISGNCSFINSFKRRLANIN